MQVEETSTSLGVIRRPMDPRARRVRLRTLVREELWALPRNTFALAAIAAVVGILAVPISFLIVGEAGLEETLTITWLVLPLVVAILVAGRVAGVRRSRFVDSLYTTPIAQSTWFAAQLVVGATLGMLVLAIHVPFILVFVAWLGVPDILLPIALAAVGVAAFAVALGLFCGVILGDASPLAAAGLAGGLAFVSFVLFLVHSLLVQEIPTSGRDLWLRLTALSPIALAADAAGIGMGGMTPANGWRPALGLAALTAGLGGAAWVAYTRAQSPLGWESGRGRAVILALVAAAVVAPVATAEVVFIEGEGYTPGYVRGETTWIAFIARGAPIPTEPFGYSSLSAAPDLPLGEDVEYDVLVLALAPPGASVRGVHIEVKGSDVVRVVGGGRLTVPSGETDARVAAPNDAQTRPLYRVPVTLRAVTVEELGNSPSPVEVHTEFTADGRRFTSVGRMALDAEIPGAAVQLISAGLLLPGAALAGSVVRKRSMR